MLKNQWYVILESKELKDKPLGILRLGLKLLLFRDENNQVACLSDICCHRGASLAGGKIMNNHIRCPFHGLEYATDGKCVVIPANGRSVEVPSNMLVKPYPCRERHGFIFMYYCEEVPETIPEPEFFEDIDDTMDQATIRQHWNTHYTRAMENQLDVAHLPFVHYDTIGKTGKTVVDGPGVEWTSERRMNVYIYNHKENGMPHKMPAEVPVPDMSKENKLELILPNIWQNYITKHLRIMGAFAPVDENNVVIYFRVYQDFVRFPGLRKLVTRASKCYARKIALQDKRVVETQLPKKPGLHGEHLFAADKPVIEFRKRRKEIEEQYLQNFLSDDKR